MSMTAWSIVGFTGTGLFASRWLVQLYGAHRAGRSVVMYPSNGSCSI